MTTTTLDGAVRAGMLRRLEAQVVRDLQFEDGLTDEELAGVHPETIKRLARHALFYEDARRAVAREHRAEPEPVAADGDVRYLTTRQAAERTGYCVDVLRDHIRAGRIRSVQFFEGGRHMIPEAELANLARFNGHGRDGDDG